MTEKESIMRECDVCHHVNPATYCRKCIGCESILCLACCYRKNFECPKCGGYFISMYQGKNEE